MKHWRKSLHKWSPGGAKDDKDKSENANVDLNSSAPPDLLEEASAEEKKRLQSWSEEVDEQERLNKSMEAAMTIDSPAKNRSRSASVVSSDLGVGGKQNNNRFRAATLMIATLATLSALAAYQVFFRH